MRNIFAVVACFGFVASMMQPVHAATYDFSLLYQGKNQGTGQFSFSDSLLGQTVSATDLISFNVSLVLFQGSEIDTFTSLGDPSKPGPLAGDPSPYLKFNTVTNLFVPEVVSGNSVLLAGNTGLINGLNRGFILFPTSNLIYVENVMSSPGTFFGFGMFDTIVATREPVPEPGTLLLIGSGVLTSGLVAAKRKRRGGLNIALTPPSARPPTNPAQ